MVLVTGSDDVQLKRKRKREKRTVFNFLSPHFPESQPQHQSLGDKKKEKKKRKEKKESHNE